MHSLNEIVDKSSIHFYHEDNTVISSDQTQYTMKVVIKVHELSKMEAMPTVHSELMKFWMSVDTARYVEVF